MDVRSMFAAQKYEASRSATQPVADGVAAETILNVAKDFAQTLREGEAVAIAATKQDVDPHKLVQALTQSELAVETAVIVRNKVVEAYQEILRMPV